MSILQSHEQIACQSQLHSMLRYQQLHVLYAVTPDMKQPAAALVKDFQRMCQGEEAKCSNRSARTGAAAKHQGKAQKSGRAQIQQVPLSNTTLRMSLVMRHWLQSLHKLFQVRIDVTSLK